VSTTSVDITTSASIPLRDKLTRPQDTPDLWTSQSADSFGASTNRASHIRLNANDAN
jgi:hypothetical protein